jgi:hypothetical protein
LPSFPSIFKANYRNALPGCNGIYRPVQEAGVMVTIGAQANLGRHAEKPRGLPRCHAALHEPGLSSELEMDTYALLR